MGDPKVKELSARQIKAIELIAVNGFTKADAALAIGVSERTVFGWFSKNAAFAEAFQRAMKEAVRREDWKEKYRYISEKAMERLCALMECGDPKTELAAAKEILSRLSETPSDAKNEDSEFQQGDGLLEAVLAAMRGS